MCRLFQRDHCKDFARFGHYCKCSRAAAVLYAYALLPGKVEILVPHKCLVGDIGKEALIVVAGHTRLIGFSVAVGAVAHMSVGKIAADCGGI